MNTGTVFGNICRRHTYIPTSIALRHQIKYFFSSFLLLNFKHAYFSLKQQQQVKIEEEEEDKKLSNLRCLQTRTDSLAKQRRR